jgi:multidrug efflux pump subunit AcrA (membrane-fusion protein)
MMASMLTLTVGCSKGEEETEPTVSVQVAPAQRAEIQHIIRSDAILFPIDQAAITPKISAPIKKFLVNRGSVVHQDQLLAVLESRDLAAAEQENKGSYEQAQAEYESSTRMNIPAELQKAQLDVTQARKALDAEEKAYQSRLKLLQQGAIAQREVDQQAVSATQAQSTYDLAVKHLQDLQQFGSDQALKSAKGQLAAAQGRYEASTAQLSYSEIRSPINGVITDRPLYPGEMATAGTPLLVVMDTSQIIAKAHIPQQDAADLKQDDEASITTAELHEPVQGKVMLVSPGVDSNSTTVEVWVRVPNKDRKLRPGITANVSIVAQTVKDAVVVPASAVINSEDAGPVVMIAGDDGRAHQQPVQVGISEGDKVQITKGLAAGARIIIAGAYGLPDKTKVSIATSTPSEEANADGKKSDEEK